MAPRDEPPPPSYPQRAATHRPAPFPSTDPAADRQALVELAGHFGVPSIDLAEVGFPLTNLELIPVEVARRHVVLPFLVRDDAIFLAMANPGERRVVEELEFVMGRRVFPHVGRSDQITWAIDHAYALRDRQETQFVGPRVGQARPAPPPAPPAPPPPPAPGGTARAGPGVPARGVTTLHSISAPDARILPDDLVDLDSHPRARDSSGGTTGALFTAGLARPGEGPRHTVLVVDDEEDIRRLLRRVLEDRGYRVLEADRGSIALSMVKQYAPDGIVLDAMLPELHGFDICRRIKSSVRYGHIPILMISAVYRGWRFAEDLKAAYGVTAYIEKPFRIAEVVAAVESMLAGAPKADARDPDELTAEADAALRTGMEAYKRGELDAAIEHVQRAISLDPLSYRLHYHLALLVGRKGDVFLAIQELEVTIDLNPRSFPALKNLAVLYQKTGFKNKAIEMWERAISQSPDPETRGQIKEHLMALL